MADLKRYAVSVTIAEITYKEVPTSTDGYGSTKATRLERQPNEEVFNVSALTPSLTDAIDAGVRMLNTATDANLG